MLCDRWRKTSDGLGRLLLFVGWFFLHRLERRPKRGMSERRANKRDREIGDKRKRAERGRERESLHDLGCPTYVMFMSTLTPGAALGPLIKASVDTQSTSVAVIPPCRLPIRFVSSSPTFISHTSFPSPPDNTFSCKGNGNKNSR
jgi:hypothetical protein